jgi:hypothetical protein
MDWTASYPGAFSYAGWRYYSMRKAFMGSMLEARRAGMRPANPAGRRQYQHSQHKMT